MLQTAPAFDWNQVVIAITATMVAFNTLVLYLQNRSTKRTEQKIDVAASQRVAIATDQKRDLEEVKVQTNGLQKQLVENAVGVARAEGKIEGIVEHKAEVAKVVEVATKEAVRAAIEPIVPLLAKVIPTSVKPS